MYYLLVLLFGISLTFGAILLYIQIALSASRFNKRMYLKIFASIHVRQVYAWDCGQSCVKMVLLWLNPAENIDIDAVVKLSSRGKPSWTIELFIFLKNRNIKATMWTTCVDGINPHHFELKWYRKDINEECSKVLELFQTARNNDWPIMQGNLPLKEFSLLLNNTTSSSTSSVVAITLVDGNAIHLTNNNNNRITTEFTGHYILIVGYDSEMDVFYYLDPAQNPDVLSISSARLQHARSVRGTDYDVIICERS